MKKKQEIFDQAHVLPNETEIEKVVLGAIMLEKSAFETVCDILNPDVFYNQNHAAVYSAIVRLARLNQPIDIITVIDSMKTMGAINDSFGPFQIVALTNSVTSSANLESHAMLLLSLSNRRRLIRICSDDAAKALNPEFDIKETLQAHDQSITSLMNSGPSGNLSAVEDVVMSAIARVNELRTKDSHITGVPSGFRELDMITHGWQDSDLIVLAARPSMGKTALALRMLRHASENRYKSVCAGFFSLEMSKGQLINRLLSSESGVFLGDLVSGRVNGVDMDKLMNAAKTISGLEIFIDDTPGLGIMELKSKVRRLHRKHKLGIVFIDYMQLMTDSTKNNREQEIGSISRNLKGLAKELSIPVVALCQLSREVEKRSDKTPQLSDLRESGAIEQDADMVLFLYRPEYYGNDVNEMGESNSGLCEVKIAKHRNGALDKIKLSSNLGIQSFYDWIGPIGKAPGSSFIPVKLATENAELF